MKTSIILEKHHSKRTPTDSWFFFVVVLLLLLFRPAFPGLTQIHHSVLAEHQEMKPVSITSFWLATKQSVERLDSNGARELWRTHTDQIFVKKSQRNYQQIEYAVVDLVHFALRCFFFSKIWPLA